VKGHLQKNRIPTRALKEARYTRTLTLILSLTGRGNRTDAGEDLVQQEHRPTEIIPLNASLTVPSSLLPASQIVLLSPLPVRERMKVRVLMQRAVLRANQDSASAPNAFLSPLPVRERMKVRVLMQRAFSARESGFPSFSRCLRAAKEFVDRAKNLLHTLEHLAIPESKHSIALRLEKRGSDFIFSRSVEMLRPIKLDDEPSVGRAKISEVHPDRKLTSKLGAAHLPPSQMLPQNPLRLSLLASQPSRVVLGRFNRLHRFECSRSVEEKQVPRKEQNPMLLSPLPVRERMKVRVLIQRACLARESRFRVPIRPLPNE
jgi:hypothetical protein